MYPFTSVGLFNGSNRKNGCKEEVILKMNELKIAVDKK